MQLAVLLVILIIVLAVDTGIILHLVSDVISDLHGAPYVPIPIKVAKEALKLAKVGPHDVIYDLGCGDGRVLFLAAHEFGVKRAVGFEVGWWPYISSKFKVPRPRRGKAEGGQSSKFKKNVEIKRADFWQQNISEASVVYLYLMPKTLKKLREKLKKELKPGTRVVSARFEIEGWKAKKVSRQAQFPIYLYEV